jgi:cbb3-type cytochrome oxidase subunit 3
METFKHLTGLCGETHPNIYTILFILILVFTIYILYKNERQKEI